MQTQMRLTLFAFLGIMAVGRLVHFSVDNSWNVITAMSLSFVLLMVVSFIVTFSINRRIRLAGQNRQQ